MSANIDDIFVRRFGFVEYLPVFEEMQAFSAERDEQVVDQLWIVQHHPVYTLGRNGKPEHVLNPGVIPLVQVDRGGQVTYHGPGQIVIYLMLDIRRKQLGVRQVVTAMENAIVSVLASININAYPKPEAPGVYVDQKKIASLGLRIKNGKSYHGLALNVDMDLSPFQGINPCGYEGLQVTQVKDESENTDFSRIEGLLVQALANELNYKKVKELVE